MNAIRFTAVGRQLSSIRELQHYYIIYSISLVGFKPAIPRHSILLQHKTSQLIVTVTIGKAATSSQLD